MTRLAVPAPQVEARSPIRRSVLAIVCVALVAAIALTVVSRTKSYARAAGDLVGADPPPVLVAGDPGPVRAQQHLEMPAPQPLAAFDVSPIVLTYHQVSPDAEGLYNITPERFAQDMASLHEAGWTTIGTSEYLGWLDGRVQLPARTMMLTFDDGTSGTWSYVDPMLRQYGYQAIAFIVTGFIGQGDYYLTWPELRRLDATGRWDIESHGHLGHAFVSADAQGTEAPSLINRRWVGGALEPLGAFEARVTDDLQQNLEILRRRGFERPRMFAYPFAAANVPSNDPEAAVFTASLVKGLFDAAMADNVEVASQARPDPHHAPRVGITSDVELPTVFARQLPVFGPQLPGS